LSLLSRITFGKKKEKIHPSEMSSERLSGGWRVNPKLDIEFLVITRHATSSDPNLIVCRSLVS